MTTPWLDRLEAEHLLEQYRDAVIADVSLGVVDPDVYHYRGHAAYLQNVERRLLELVTTGLHDEAGR